MLPDAQTLIWAAAIIGLLAMALDILSGPPIA